MNKAVVIGAAAVVLGVAGAAGLFGYERHQAQQQLQALRLVATAAMKDPAGTQFRAERVTPGGALCAEMNSPNGYGALTGFRRVVALADGTAYVEGIGYAGKPRQVLDPDAAKDSDELDQLELDFTRSANRFNATVAAGQQIAVTTDQARQHAIKELFERRWKAVCA